MKKKAFLFFMIMLPVTAFLFYKPAASKSDSSYEIWLKKREDAKIRQDRHATIVLNDDFSFTGLELIHVGPGTNYYSRLGHLLLRFIGSGKEKESDITLSFLGDFNDYPVNDLKGLLGGYTVLPRVDTISRFYQEYALDQKRTFVRYTMKTSADQNKKLQNILKDWIQNPEKPGSYTFIHNNCVGLVHRYFVAAGVEIPFWRTIFPDSTPQFYQRIGLIKDLSAREGML